MAKTAKKVVNATLTEEAKEMLMSALKEETEMEFIPTGNIGMDLALTNGKGLPLGSSFLLWAEPGCGKTTLVGDVCKRLIELHDTEEKPFNILYLDSEGSLSLLNSIGLDEHRRNKKFIYFDKSLSWRQVEHFYNAVLNKVSGFENVKVIVIDSIGNILSDANTSKSVADGDFGTKAKERSNFYSKYLPLCREHGITSIFISQARHNQDATTPYVDKKKIAATYADKHSVDVILKCGTKASKQDADKVVETSIFGEEKNKYRWIMTLTSIAEGCKNRFFKGGTAEVLLTKGVGCDNTYVIRKMLEAHKLITNPSAGYYKFSEVLCTNFNIPDTKMRLKDVKEHIKNNFGSLISLVQEMGIYKLGVSEKVEETAEDEDDDE